VTKIVTLPLSFIDATKKNHSATCALNVLDGKGKDIIIGTPSIFTHFGTLFSSMVGDAVQRYGQATVAVDMNNLEHRYDLVPPINSLDLYNLGYTDLVPPENSYYPWTTDVMNDAPEDLLIPEASSYNSTVLQFLDQSYDDTVLKYLKWIDTGVDQAFLDATNVRQLMLDYTDCFVRKEWTRMNIPEVDFKFSDEMPARMKPRTRPIPPSLYPATKKNSVE
jgi:hypothetical protein